MVTQRTSTVIFPPLAEDCSFSRSSPVQSSTMTEHGNECKPLGLRLLSKTPRSAIIALIFSFSGHSENPSGGLKEREMLTMSEEVIFWFLWCRRFVWKAEFNVSPADDSSHIAY